MKAHLASLSPLRLYGGIALIVLGVALLVAEVVLSFIGRRNVQWSSVSVSALIMYAGCAFLNGRAAHEQGQFVVDSVVRVVGTIRDGRKTQVFTGTVAPERRSGDERRADPPTPVDPASLPPEDRG